MLELVGWGLEAVAVVICLSWLWVNAYHYYPMVASAVGSLGARLRGTAETPDPLTEDELPTIDVLLPAYRESEVIENSIASVRATDYPQEKLTLAVLVEPDDEATRAELDRIADDYEFTVITVPEAYPGRPNKPRALNYGFERTDGDVVSITDAEDIVDPDLYRTVARKLVRGECDYVQGRLDMVNEDDGWMNTLFRAEYGYWYEVNTPAKYRRSYPIPLGGTTCFFPRSLLEEMSDRRLDTYEDRWDAADWAWVRDHGLDGYRPWDPHNVTEDFELGLFLWQTGHDPGYVEATPTAEESPLSLHAWVRQRTRWKKGKIQTFLQYVRTRPDTLREKVHVYTQSAVPHLGPINITSVLAILLVGNLLGYRFHPVTSAVLGGAFALAAGMTVLYAYGYWTVSEKPLATRLRRAAVVGLTLPFYWFMQWLADVRAIQQTYTGKFHWAKTKHFGRNVNPDGGVRQATLFGRERETVLPTQARLLMLVGIVAVGVTLRLYRLGEWSLYGDELYSITARGSLPPVELLTVPLALDSHPPLYYFLLHYWMELFGNSVVSARAMSVALSAGAMVVLYFLGKELFDDRVGLLATLLFALSSFHVHYGRIARMYSLFALLALASWYGFVRLRERLPALTVGYVVATALLAYTHVFGLFVVGAQWLYVLLSETRAGIDLRQWVGVQGALGVLVAPWLAMLAGRVVGLATGGAGGTIIGWVPEPSFGIVTNTVLRYVGWPHHYPILTESTPVRLVAAALVVVYAGCLVLAVARYRQEDGFAFTDLPTAGHLSALLVVPILVPFVLSFLVVPVYFPRFTLPASLALFLLVAAGILNIARRRRRLLVVGIVLLCSLTLVGQYHATDTSADWEGAAGCLNAGVEEGDAVLYQTFWIQNYVEYYQSTPGADKYGVLSPDELTASREYGYNVSQVARLAGEYDRVWLVQYQPSAENRVHDVIRSTHDPSVMRQYGPLLVSRFDGGEERKTLNETTLPRVVNETVVTTPGRACGE